jgi:hypothetical protein
LSTVRRRPRHCEGYTGELWHRLRGFCGLFLACCAHAEETVSGDAREDAMLKTARTAREAGAMWNMILSCGAPSG